VIDGEQSPVITFRGAAGTVTGSCFELAYRDEKILVDCGLFQGSRSLEELNFLPFDFDPAGLTGVALTHAHIDHSGLLPKLVANGFRGRIWSTAPTADLLRPMLADSGRIQEQDTHRRNRRRDRRKGKRFAPLYTQEDAERVWEFCSPVEIGEHIAMGKRIKARFWDAGHILGSASVEIVAGGVRMLFSGDLGPGSKAFHSGPSGPRGIDHVFCECTYGNRPREAYDAKQRRDLLREEVLAAMSQGGNLVIPVFALERTQELLHDLYILRKQNSIPSVPIFIDSPLATRVTDVYARHLPEGNEEAGGFLKDGMFHFVEDVASSIRLNSVSGAIILAASGMCEAGRIRHHLFHNLHRHDSTVLIVGFQAQGTLGRVLLGGAQQVRISGRDVDVLARVRSIDCYSAHADQRELVDWIDDRAPISGSVMLVHGEQQASLALQTLLRSTKPERDVQIPLLGESYRFESARPAQRILEASDKAKSRIGSDWQNSYAELVTSMKSRLLEIEDERKRRDALVAMHKLLDDLKAA
jgi:metallo-beta-lactamase family protein